MTVYIIYSIRYILYTIGLGGSATKVKYLCISSNERGTLIMTPCGGFGCNSTHSECLWRWDLAGLTVKWLNIYIAAFCM